MFIYVLQLREALRGRPGVLLFFAVFATAVWVMWALKTVLSRRYKPWTEPYSVTASVVIPVVDEPADLFMDVLSRIVRQQPDEVIVVINGERNEQLERVCDALYPVAPSLTWVWTDVASKRNAVRIGVEMATGELIVLVDSDTMWEPDTLRELVKPFADPQVGGVSTKQRILQPTRSFLTRWADWMENSRARYSMPAQSVLGQVGCLPGRTIAFRRQILADNMEAFMGERFLGVFLEVSDDRTLTNLALKAGFRTVYQETSLVYTDSHTRLRRLFRQQLRWARGSQYNTLRMLPWMLSHAPVLAVFFLADILLPFVFAGALFGWAWHAVTHTGINFLSPVFDVFPGIFGWTVVIGLVVVGSSFSVWLRQHRHLQDVPPDWLWMPAYVLFCSVFLMPVRLLGFFRMAHAAPWGSRANAYIAKRNRRVNLLAGVPYLLGAFIIGSEIALVARFS